ncbi:MAG: hypothetical protein B9S32_14960 [Verrucomicrobia bacterium Tous-C9LFEB]|nr:MAG: hypothetical protein B9S32_14960 [Verrucomicrobia bacterium Tous-C9LFEB]
MKHTSLHSRFAQRGFTLIELLVVVAIIALLAGLMFPVLTRGIRQAKISQSLSNLRQIGMVAQQFANDNNGVYPKLQETIVPGNDGTWLSQLWPLAYPSKNGLPGYGEKLRGTIFYTPMIEPTPTARAFGWNAVLESAGNFPSRKYGLLPIPSQTVLVADTKTSSTLYPTTIHARNNGAANVLYADGHVGQVLASEIPTVQSALFWNGKP